MCSSDLELARRSWARETVVIGAATDPYQPVEGRFRLTRGCLEAFAEHANPLALITRGPMIIRDIDVLQDASRRAKVGVSLSVPTLDDTIHRVTEPGTAPPRQRLRAVRMLADAGIRVAVAMAPIIPGISNRPDLLRDAVRAARDAGAVRMGVLHGATCVGCCWVLMLVGFAGGLASVSLMVVAAALMALEKLPAIAARLTIPLGVALVVAGVLWLVMSPGSQHSHQERTSNGSVVARG